LNSVSPVTPDARIVSIRALGMPHSPKPPDMMVMPSRNTSANAAPGLAKILRMRASSSGLWLNASAAAKG
jgi:hypothetical protein